MKRTLSLIACVAVCCTMAVSCKNAKTAEPTPEEIQAQKQALADSVLAEIDAIVDEYVPSTENAFYIPQFELTEEEKMVMPDFLLDPSVAGTLVTKSQKVNALAIYIVDCGIRIIYDMPMEEAKEVIAKLAVEINYPIDVNASTYFEMPASEKIKKEYEAFKERGDLAYFWQFQHALIVEVSYILAQNPELFFNKISEEQWQSYRNRVDSKNEALAKLAQYDEELAQVWDFERKNRVTASDDEWQRVGQSIESAKQFRIANKDKYIARRNALLQ